MKCWRWIAASLFLSFGNGETTEVSPWLGNVYEFELRSAIRYQGYERIDSDDHLKCYASNDVFLNLTLCNAIPDPSSSIELEATEARTRRQRGNIDQLKLTGRYLWLDDVAGDSFSFITGISYVQAFQESLKDVSSFHHGLYNGEFFISVGKENSDGLLWGNRWWGTFSIGVAERGSPWVAMRLNLDKRWFEKHVLSAFVDALCGLGGKRLRLHDFQGYGPVQHRSVDVGLRYAYDIEYYGVASFEYAFRPYAQNFPVYTHQLKAQLLYTFGL